MARQIGLSCICSSRRRHTRCALVTGVQTCALPIFLSDRPYRREDHQPAAAEDAGKEPARSRGRKVAYTRQGCLRRRSAALPIGRRAVEAGQEADEVLHGGRHQPAAGIDREYGGVPRSEEHTSELQSLMRTSYAVFCLKKKTCNTDRKRV